MSRTIRAGISVLAAIWIIASTPQAALAAQISSVNAPTGAIYAVRPVAEAFEAALMPQNECLTEAIVTFEDLPGRFGEYRGNGSIVINPNRAVDSMPTTLAHELGHHFMLACSIQTDSEFRERFYAAQGLSLAQSWFDSSSGWSASPAEHFAEAVALYTTGYSDGRIRISPTTLSLIAEFAQPAKPAWATLPAPLTNLGARRNLGSSDVGPARQRGSTPPESNSEIREFSLPEAPLNQEHSPTLSGRIQANSSATQGQPS